jgi:hypothetical protein
VGQQRGAVPLEKGAGLAVARTLLNRNASRQLKTNTSAAHNHNQQYMKKFLLGLIAVAAVLLPLSQNAQAHWGYYHHYYGYHHAYWHRSWHGGYWYGGFWHPGYWYGGPVVVVAPY